MEVFTILQDYLVRMIQEVTFDDFKKLAKNFPVPYTEEECYQVYNFLKEHDMDLIQHKVSCFSILKNKVSYQVYQRLVELYEEYYQKYL